MSKNSDQLNQITEKIIGAAIDVHRVLGTGLLESAHKTCFSFEIAEQGLKVSRQVPLPIVYKGVKLECGYRLDLLVDDGLSINFNVRLLKNGIVRTVNNLKESPRTQRFPRFSTQE